MKLICEYGCGQQATHIFKSGKRCCVASTSKCPAMVASNSAKVKAARDKKGDSFWRNGHPKGSKNGTSLKGKTYEEIFGVDRAISRKEQSSQANKGKDNWSKVSPETKEKIAIEQRARILARYEQGWMPKAGRCKKIQYDSKIAGTVLLDGTWELTAAQYMDKMQWTWLRNTKRFPYINLKGVLSHYTPDFYVKELDGYLEVKGYETELDRCKWAQFNEGLTVWKKDTILTIMDRGPDGKAAGC